MPWMWYGRVRLIVKDGRLQEVPNIVIWYFGKLVAKKNRSLVAYVPEVNATYFPLYVFFKH